MLARAHKSLERKSFAWKEMVRMDWWAKNNCVAHDLSIFHARLNPGLPALPKRFQEPLDNRIRHGCEMISVPIDLICERKSRISGHSTSHEFC
jgi:hypothetical protein